MIVYHTYSIIKRTLALLMFCLLSSYTIYSQTTYTISEDGVIDTNLVYTDTLTFADALKQKLADYIADDFIAAAIDSVSKTPGHVIAHLYKGLQYQYGNIKVSKENQTLINAAGLRRYDWKENVVSPDQLQNYSNEVILFLENNGYPFAKVSLDSIKIDEHTINAIVDIDKGPYIVWDSLNLTGNVNLTEQYMRQYLQIKKGEAFNRVRYNNLKKRINELPFLKLVKDPELRFYNKKAELNLTTEAVKSNRFDFLIGILPAPVGSEDGLVVTGEFTAEMYNKLGYGEYLFASFERLQTDVQELDLKFRYPYIGGLPIGIKTALQVYRRSGDFLELKADVGFDYQLSGLSHLEFGWNFKSSRLIDIDTSTISGNGRLPAILDVTFQGGRLAYSYEKLDYKYNPASGWNIKIAATLGQKSIIPNASIQQIKGSQFDFSTAYDSIQLRTFQVQSDINIAYYLPLAKLITLKSSVRGGVILNQDVVYENEYYRLGGYKLLRGFNEQSVLAESFVLSTAELRLLLNRNSYLTLPFIDFGYAKVKNNPANANTELERVLGIGIGINFSTPAGLFNVSFASGKRGAGSLDFGNPKVHFGYVSLF